MSTLALDLTPVTLPSPLRRSPPWRTPVIAGVLLVPALFYLSIMVLLIREYGEWPNTFTLYDWIANVRRIIVGTGSVSDMVPIILDEWLLEAGYVTPNYGRGVTVWSLSIVPHKLLLVSLAGGLLGLNVALLLVPPEGGTVQRQALQFACFAVLAGAGLLGVCITSATVFSVVHCASPSWTGSLAVLGLDAYGLAAVEPYGALICTGGLLLLAASAVLIARDRRSTRCLPIPAAREAAPC